MSKGQREAMDRRKFLRTVGRVFMAVEAEAFAMDE